MNGFASSLTTPDQFPSIFLPETQLKHQIWCQAKFIYNSYDFVYIELAESEIERFYECDGVKMIQDRTLFQ